MSQANRMDALVNQALEHHQAGRLQQAEALYRQILSQQPDQANALHLLGVLACQADRNADAVDLISRAIAIFPRHPVYHSNLGEALRKLGQIDRAIDAFRHALAIDPNFADAYLNYGLCLYNAGKIEEACGVFGAATRALPENAGLLRHLGDMLVRLRRWDEAISAYKSAVRVQPSLLEAQYNLAVALAAQGRQQEAAQAYGVVVAATPEDLNARMGLGSAFFGLLRYSDALQMFQSVIDRCPTHAQAHQEQANVWRAGDRLDEGIAAYRRALACKPEPDRLIQANLGFALRDFAEHDEAVALLRAAVTARPDATAIRSGLIFTLQVIPWADIEMIAVEQRRWNDLYVKPLVADRAPYANDRSPDRRLKIGYVSADLRNHPVGRFMMPLLKNHHRARVEVFCYSNTTQPDAVTTGLRAACDQWRQVSSMNDDEFAQTVRRDGIDILIDLSMHAIDNRLLTFARKPAPVQMTYLAYCGGTGLETIDYRLTDPFIDPPKSNDKNAGIGFERPLHLETYWCYAPMSCAGEVNPLPARTTGHITFGSFNYFCKVNSQVLDTWAALLREVPQSRLMLHVPHGSRHAMVRDFFAARQVDASRLMLVPRSREPEYFKHYGSVDIALDVFPFAGGTTTCDALWMGVPVVTMAGERTVSRGGMSILSTLELADLIAHDPQGYCRIVRSLAGDWDRLEALRAGLRTRMKNSPLMDAPRFARSMEEAFHKAWKAWCAGK